MSTLPTVDLPTKPRMLIADDSRIVRATLMKHVQGLFEFREALDGEQAWETLLIDPNIRLLITDLSMPRLDGYGLLLRIRSSKIARIRDMPVVVVSGNNEQSERDRVIAAGATDLISKGIETAQLISRLDILSNLAETQRDFERSLEALIQRDPRADKLALCSPEQLQIDALAMLKSTLGRGRNFVLLSVTVGLRHVALHGIAAPPPPIVVEAIGQLLQRTVRLSDRVAQTGPAEFCLVTGNINFKAARNFAERICRAIASANLVNQGDMHFVASCGVASLEAPGTDDAITPDQAGLVKLLKLAKRRANLGMLHAFTGVVEEAQESSLLRGESLQAQPAAAPAAVDLTTLARWVKEGNQSRVIDYMTGMSAELRPLIELLLEQYNDGAMPK